MPCARRAGDRDEDPSVTTLAEEGALKTNTLSNQGVEPEEEEGFKAATKYNKDSMTLAS
jgi:hypothetical protein